MAKGRQPDYKGNDDSAIWINHDQEPKTLTFQLPGHEYYYAKELSEEERARFKGKLQPHFKGRGIQVEFRSSEKVENYAVAFTAGHQPITLFYNEHKDQEEPQSEE